MNDGDFSRMLRKELPLERQREILGIIEDIATGVRNLRPKEFNPDAPYQTPRAAAYLTGLSLWYIREGCKAGTIPHIRVGRDYRIDMERFREQLKQQSIGA